MILIFVVLFVLPVALGWAVYAYDWPVWLMVIAMAPWSWVWISGIWDVLTGHVNQRTIDDNPNPWYTP